MEEDSSRLRIKVVGVCASGKTTLVKALRNHGYPAGECLQEHSYVHDMWRRLHPPDVLIYLDAPLETIRQRRPGALNLDAKWLEEERRRLRHAREHCHLYFETSSVPTHQVLQRTLGFLQCFQTNLNPPGVTCR